MPVMAHSQNPQTPVTKTILGLIKLLWVSGIYKCMFKKLLFETCTYNKMLETDLEHGLKTWFVQSSVALIFGSTVYL